jgi:hypothetical protein
MTSTEMRTNLMTSHLPKNQTASRLRLLLLKIQQFGIPYLDTYYSHVEHTQHHDFQHKFNIQFATSSQKEK